MYYLCSFTGGNLVFKTEESIGDILSRNGGWVEIFYTLNGIEYTSVKACDSEGLDLAIRTAHALKDL